MYQLLGELDVIMHALQDGIFPGRGTLLFLKILGPGLVTGASDDDPSGIGTYAMAGAAFGYATLWTALVTFPLMAGVQFICAKIAMVTKIETRKAPKTALGLRMSRRSASCQSPLEAPSRASSCASTSAMLTSTESSG